MALVRPGVFAARVGGHGAGGVARARLPRAPRAFPGDARQGDGARPERRLGRRGDRPDRAFHRPEQGGRRSRRPVRRAGIAGIARALRRGDRARGTTGSAAVPTCRPSPGRRARDSAWCSPRRRTPSTRRCGAPFGAAPRSRPRFSSAACAWRWSAAAGSPRRTAASLRRCWPAAAAKVAVLPAVPARPACARRTSLAAALARAVGERDRVAAELKAVFDVSPVGMARTDLGGRVMDANDAFLRIVGADRDRLLAGGVRWDEITRPEHLERDEAAIAEAVRHGRCAPYEKEYVLPDGRRVPVLVAFVLLDRQRGDAAAFVVDLSGQKKDGSGARGERGAAGARPFGGAHGDLGMGLRDRRPAGLHGVGSPLRPGAGQPGDGRRRTRGHPSGRPPGRATRGRPAVAAGGRRRVRRAVPRAVAGRRRALAARDRPGHGARRGRQRASTRAGW